MAEFNYDVVVIGAGPGGYVAGIRAAQLGLKVAVVEKDKPGGVCLNMGCIPSKALIHQADIFRTAQDFEQMGVKVDSSSFDYSAVFKKSRKAAQTLSRGVEFLLKKNKVELVKGEGVIRSPHEIAVNGEKTLTGKNIIIATGSRPRDIPGFKYDEKKVLSSDGALMLEKLPASIIILGGGFIGVEFAHILNSFGVEVTVVELLERILPIEDEESSQVLTRSFKKRKIKMYTSTKAVAMNETPQGVQLELEKGDGEKQSIEAEKLLVVVGRAPNTEGIGLENVDIKTERGFIPVSDYYRTKIPSIYAIGDVVDTPQLAHVASREGEIAVEHIAGKNPEPKIDLFAIPSAVYCEPQVASFGYKEYQLRENKIDYKKAVFPYRASGKAVAVENYEGMVKILYNPETYEILGAHIAGLNATELIHELLLAKSSELLPGDIVRMVHAHPTLSEAVMEAARMVQGEALHI